MTKKDINSYRLTSMKEPTDELLSSLMKDVAKNARERSKKAHDMYFKQMNEDIRVQKKIWSQKYNIQFGNA